MKPEPSIRVACEKQTTCKGKTVGNTRFSFKGESNVGSSALLSCPPAVLKEPFWETEGKEGSVSDKWRAENSEREGDKREKKREDR